MCVFSFFRAECRCVCSVKCDLPCETTAISTPQIYTTTKIFFLVKMISNISFNRTPTQCQNALDMDKAAEEQLGELPSMDMAIIRPSKEKKRTLKYMLMSLGLFALISANVSTMYGAVVLLRMAFARDAPSMFYTWIFAASVLISLFVVLFIGFLALMGILLTTGF